MFPPCLVSLSSGPNRTDSEAISEIDDGTGNNLFTVESASTASRSSFGQWEAGFLAGSIWEISMVSLRKTRYDKWQAYTSVTWSKHEIEDLGRIWWNVWHFVPEKKSMNNNIVMILMMNITISLQIEQCYRKTQTLPHLGLSTVKVWSSTAYRGVMHSGSGMESGTRTLGK